MTDAPPGFRELSQACADDPFVRCEILPDAVVHRTPGWWIAERVGQLRGRGWVLLRDPAAGPVTDDTADLSRGAALVRSVCPPGDAVAVTLEREFWERAAPLLPTAARGGDWDWMATTRDPDVQPLEDALTELDDEADAAELTALNTRDSPTAESEPGTGRTELWLGVREAGRILAAGALHRTPAGAPFLAGIVVDRTARGRGLGAAVVAGLTRAGLRTPGPLSGLVMLGMYADNDTARRLYHRLGYRTHHRFASRRLTG